MKNIQILMSDGTTATDIKDITAPLYFTRNWKLWILSCAAVSLVIIVLLVYFLLRRRAARKALAARPAHDIAYSALEALRSSGLLKNGLVSEYFFRLSFIVRQYIENRFRWRAPEMTTEEFLMEISNVGARRAVPLQNQHIKDMLKDFLEKADLVKFAKYGPTADEITGAFNAATKLIDETKNESSLGL